MRYQRASIKASATVFEAHCTSLAVVAADRQTYDKPMLTSSVGDAWSTREIAATTLCTVAFVMIRQNHEGMYDITNLELRLSGDHRFDPSLMEGCHIANGVLSQVLIELS